MPFTMVGKQRRRTLMKICDRCGQQNPVEARFCRGCGHRFPDNVPVSEPARQAAAPVPSVPLPGPGLVYTSPR
ncbi:zinc-ribbon domain-containing protein, partial [Bifidobacterium catulorum]|uniref:zinc-ribbon domain-containing protein n=1 Tax=Bifidobacterium catulorum TaxID=1630173 RepID=UPI0034DEFA73